MGGVDASNNFGNRSPSLLCGYRTHRENGWIWRQGRDAHGHGVQKWQYLNYYPNHDHHGITICHLILDLLNHQHQAANFQYNQFHWHLRPHFLHLRSELSNCG